MSTAPGANASGRDKDTKDNNNNTSTNNETNGRSAALERAYVHEVYENCEEPFGSIRPRVAQFLSNLDAGSLVCDVGCGNGRYLTAACNPAIYSIGVDRCYRLAKTARSSGSEVSGSISRKIKFHTLSLVDVSTNNMNSSESSNFPQNMQQFAETRENLHQVEIYN